MATLSLTVLPAKALKDGKHKVRIALAHNSTTRYILTDVVLDNINEWKNGRVVKRGDAAYLNAKLAQAIANAQKEIDSVPYTEGLTCAELLAAMKQSQVDKTRTLVSVFEEMLEVATCKETTKRTYRIIFIALTKSIPETTMVANITPLMVRRMVAERTKNCSPGTVANALTLLGTILHYCQRNGYTHFVSLPTEGVQRPKIPIRQNWLTVEQVRQIRDLTNITVCDRKFRDYFMLSYYLGGVNLIDLATINFAECGTHLKYVRTKTNRMVKANPYVEFDIPYEAQDIISRYIQPSGYLELWDAKKEALCVNLGQYARLFREHHDFPGLTYYSARKSFAQHAFNIGISESVIDYILGHSLGTNKSCLYSYIKVTPAMATEAVRKVCDLIASSGNF